MRFDDTLTTVLTRPAGDGAGLASVWAQIVDILAQDRGTISASNRAEAMARVHALRAEIPEDARRATAEAIAYQCRSAELVQLFGSDKPSIAAIVLKGARLTPGQWADIIPTLPTPSRALLRQRRDLPQTIRLMLDSFGPADFMLPFSGSTEPQRGPEAATGLSIAALIDKVENFNRARPASAAPLAVTSRSSRPAVHMFRFESDAHGFIRIVEGVSGAPLVGLDISVMAEAGSHGVDGQAAGAFKGRAPFRNAHMFVPGEGPVSGGWLISGLPRFSEETGRFLGYRATARRMTSDDQRSGVRADLPFLGLPTDALRQLVHELRTPLNAICGFAEIISAQLYGPVIQSYRLRADAIVLAGLGLSRLFDELDLSAQLERGELPERPCLDAGLPDMLTRLRAEVEEGADWPGHIALVDMPEVPMVDIDLGLIEQLMVRLLSALLSATLPGEGLGLRLSARDSHVTIMVDRPSSLVGLSDAALFDPTRETMGGAESQLPLGFAFAMRVVRRLADAMGARLEISRVRFTVRLPAEYGFAVDVP